MSKLTDEIAAQAPNYKMSPEEKRAQRISLIMGLRSHRSTLTRETVESLMEEMEGLPERASPRSSA